MAFLDSGRDPGEVTITTTRKIKRYLYTAKSKPLGKGR